jgi:hypothetical protein
LLREKIFEDKQKQGNFHVDSEKCE